MDDVPILIQHIDGLQWVVIRTKSRCEKKVQTFCSGRGIPHYLPLRRSVRRYKNRTNEFQVPIFPGYLFCQVSYADVSKVNECQHVAHVLRPTPEMEIQLIAELRSIQIFEEAIKGGELTVKPEIAVGDLIVVKTGPMAGLNGIVTRWKNTVRLSVNVEMVGQSVSMELDAGEIELDI